MSWIRKSASAVFQSFVKRKKRKEAEAKERQEDYLCEFMEIDESIGDGTYYQYSSSEMRELRLAFDALMQHAERNRPKSLDEARGRYGKSLVGSWCDGYGYSMPPISFGIFFHHDGTGVYRIETMMNGNRDHPFVWEMVQDFTVRMRFLRPDNYPEDYDPEDFEYENPFEDFEWHEQHYEVSEVNELDLPGKRFAITGLAGFRWYD